MKAIMGFLLTLGSTAMAQSPSPITEWVCQAQCVSVSGNRVDLGESASGRSRYHPSEAFYEMQESCAGGVLVLNLKVDRSQARTQFGSEANLGELSAYKQGYLTRRKVGLSVGASKRWMNQSSMFLHTEDRMNYELSYATVQNACSKIEYDPDAPRKYSGKHKLGG